MSIRITDARSASARHLARPEWVGAAICVLILAAAVCLSGCSSRTGTNPTSNQGAAESSTPEVSVSDTERLDASPATETFDQNVPDDLRVAVWDVKIGEVVYTDPDFIRRTDENGEPIAIDVAKVGLVSGGGLTVKMVRTTTGFEADLPADTRLLIDPNAKGVKVTLVG